MLAKCFVGWARASASVLCQNQNLASKCTFASYCNLKNVGIKDATDEVSNSLDAVDIVPGEKESFAINDDDNAVVNSEELDQLADAVVESLKQIDCDGSITGRDFVRDSLNEPDISQMETGEETASHPINRFRQIRYDEGELDNSDLTKPPSWDNPHPFDPNTLPPTHARSLAAYVNHLPVLQRLIDLGVDLLEIDTNTNVGRALIRLDWEKDVKPKIYWLVKDLGVSPKDLGTYLTRNPFFLLQNLDDLKRVQYMYSKSFPKSEIAKIVVKSRYWLNLEKEIIDRRLGWIQRQFRLKGEEVRQLVIKEPRIIIFGVGPFQQLVLTFNRELGFDSKQLRAMLKEDPRLFMTTSPKSILMSYNYLTKVMQISVEQIAAYPLALRCSVADLRCRHEFLCRLKLAQYNENLPKCISLKELLHPSDKYFAEKVANSYIADYNKFLKFL